LVYLPRKEDTLFPRINSKMAFLAVSTFSLLTAWGGGGAAAVMSSAEGKYIFPNSNVIAVIDVQKLVSSKIYTDQIKPLLDGNPEAKAQMEKEFTDAGLDPFKDIKTVMVSGDTDADEKMGIVITGNATLDAAKLIAKTKEKNKDAQMEAIGANSIFGIPEGKPENFAELKKGLGVDGSPAVKALWDSVDKSGAITVVVALKDKKIGAMAGGADPALAKAVALMVSANVTDAVSAKVSLRFSSADEATAAKAVADKQMADPGFAMVSGFVKVAASTSGSDLVVDVSMSKEQITMLSGMAKGLLGSMGKKPEPMPMPEPMPAPAGDPGMAPGAAPAVPAAP
jgi:hypothetical protein